LSGGEPIARQDRTVVRNAAYRKSGIGIRERHNERKNADYTNPDIMVNRKHLNVHFKSCDGTYAQAFDRMVADGTISTRGLRDDAKMFDEMVFDVNTAYFEENGGYEYARRFFEEAYRMAAQEAGGEQYVLSAVMHADERNKALSDQLGRDVFHYHLHVVYVPIVEKEIRWSKRCKDKTLIGTVKGTIHQVSHSKKWSSEKKCDERGNPILTKDGKAVLINSYSLLQDRFFEHMRNAGFRGFERGERGSTAEHLDVMEFKVAQERQRATELSEITSRQQREADAMESTLEERRAEIDRVNRDVEERVARIANANEFRVDIRRLGIPNGNGSVEVRAHDWERVSNLAVAGYIAEPHIADLKRKIGRLESLVENMRFQLRELIENKEGFMRLCREAPQRVISLLQSIHGKERSTKERFGR